MMAPGRRSSRDIPAVRLMMRAIIPIHRTTPGERERHKHQYHPVTDADRIAHPLRMSILLPLFVSTRRGTPVES